MPWSPGFGRAGRGWGRPPAPDIADPVSCRGGRTVTGHSRGTATIRALLICRVAGDHWISGPRREGVESATLGARAEVGVATRVNCASYYADALHRPQPYVIIPSGSAFPVGVAPAGTRFGGARRRKIRESEKQQPVAGLLGQTRGWTPYGCCPGCPTTPSYVWLVCLDTAWTRARCPGCRWLVILPFREILESCLDSGLRGRVQAEISRNSVTK